MITTFNGPEDKNTWRVSGCNKLNMCVICPGGHGCRESCLFARRSVARLAIWCNTQMLQKSCPRCYNLATLTPATIVMWPCRRCSSCSFFLLVATSHVCFQFVFEICLATRRGRCASPGKERTLGQLPNQGRTALHFFMPFHALSLTIAKAKPFSSRTTCEWCECITVAINGLAASCNRPQGASASS